MKGSKDIMKITIKNSKSKSNNFQNEISKEIYFLCKFIICL